MPASSRRVFATHNFRVTKTAHAPLRYVYDWATDFRADDGRYSNSTTRYRVLRTNQDRVVRIRMGKRPGNVPVTAIELVRLDPPRAWHVDQIDETDLAAVDYRLTSLSPRKTKIELRVTERWMTPVFPSLSEDVRNVSDYWDHLVEALETRCARGRPAKG